jgi:hypothetical protein
MKKLKRSSRKKVVPAAVIAAPSANSKQFSLTQPSRRPLKIFATDPLLGRSVGNRITIDIANEPLHPGPQGTRIEVIDYDATHHRYYPPVNLNESAVLMQNGLDPTDSDPRFHQQMVYAVAMRTIENFDRALGRTVTFRRKAYPRLRFFPHAFYGANAFYDRELNAVVFGYFRADQGDPGPLLPGQNVFTCLSHDIIAHEVTHAIVDRLRRYFLEPSNEDVLAFHEGFADMVALFQHFSFQQLLRDQIQLRRTRLWEPTLLVELAKQFGYATGSGKALRSALDKPELKLYERVNEPHYRGSILVAAVFEGFFRTYQRRIADLIRIATGGTGNLPDADLHPDLVNRVATEAARSAQSTLSRCIRAFDYLPPVDVTFGDFLRALVTADFELSPEDEYGQRAAMIEAFRRRGIYPSKVSSLAEESLLWPPAEWPPADRTFRIPFETINMLQDLLFAATSISKTASTRISEEDPDSINRQTLFSSLESNMSDSTIDSSVNVNAHLAGGLNAWAAQHRKTLCLRSGVPIEVHGFHPVFRVAPNGQLLIELVVQLVQTDRSQVRDLGGIPFRGGTTLIASADGTVRYIIPKPLPSPDLPPETQKIAEQRLERQLNYLRVCDMADPNLSYLRADQLTNRMRARMNLRFLHQGVLG